MVKLLKLILPPVMYALFSKIYHLLRRDDNAGLYQPAWYEIKGGNLKGRQIFIDPKDGYWQKEIIEGTYDDFFYNYLSKCDLNNKVIFEIGAHIGYHAMNFAKLVGDSGLVCAFEPNFFNRERFELILSKNVDLKKRIAIYDVAVSDSVGKIDFNFSPNIDDGKSSGSFITGAHTPSAAETYNNIGFHKITVKSVSLDQLHSSLGIQAVPYLIKIDVEGAEHLVLKGGSNLIRQYNPLILVEIHTISTMFKVHEFFNTINYEMELLKEEEDGRCFIGAKKR